MRDKVVNEARKICILKAYVPRSIIKKYKTRIKDGKLIISKKG